MMPAIAESQWPAGHAFSGVMPCTNEFHLHHCSNWRCTKSASVQLHMAGKSHLTWWGIDIMMVDLRKSFTILKLLMNQVGCNNYDPSIAGLCWTALSFVWKKSGLPKSKDIIQNEASLRRPSCCVHSGPFKLQPSGGCHLLEIIPQSPKARLVRFMSHKISQLRIGTRMANSWNMAYVSADVLARAIMSLQIMCCFDVTLIYFRWFYPIPQELGGRLPVSAIRLYLLFWLKELEKTV